MNARLLVPKLRVEIERAQQLADKCNTQSMRDWYLGRMDMAEEILLEILQYLGEGADARE